MLFRPLIAFLLIAVASHCYADKATDQDGRIDCSKLLAAARAPTDNPALISALKDRRHPSTGAKVPLSIAEFEAHVREVALYLVGQSRPDRMKANVLYSEASKKLEITQFLRGFRDGDDLTIRDAIEKQLSAELKKIKYDGKTFTKVTKELDEEGHVLIVTHQLEGLQDKSIDLAATYPELKGLRPVMLVGAQSSHPLKKEVAEKARVVAHSVGGEFSFKLSSAKKVTVAGGAMDQCLAQTIHSIAKNTKIDVTIEVLMPLTYLDLKGAAHATLPELIAEDRAEAESYALRVRGDLIGLLKDDKFLAEPLTDTRSIFPTMTFRNGKGRTVRIEFRR